MIWSYRFQHDAHFVPMLMPGGWGTDGPYEVQRTIADRERWPLLTVRLDPYIFSVVAGTSPYWHLPGLMAVYMLGDQPARVPAAMKFMPCYFLALGFGRRDGNTHIIVRVAHGHDATL